MPIESAVTSIVHGVLMPNTRALMPIVMNRSCSVTRARVLPAKASSATSKSWMVGAEAVVALA
jgi:hypothetical protein